MVAYKLIYFDSRGRAEPIRLMFHHAGVPFEDQRLSHEEFGKIKSTFESGQLPCLEVDGKRLFQSIAISRYVATQLGLVGKTDWESAHADMVAGAFGDFITAIFPVLGTIFTGKQDKMAEEWKKSQDTVKQNLDKFETLLTSNGNGFFVGNSITWADFLVAEFFDKLQHFIAEGALKDHPNCEALRKRVFNLPRVKEYVENRIHRGQF